MNAPTDARRILNGFFRQGWKFAFIFIPIFSTGLLYSLLATPQFESTAKLLVKFGQDARPSVSSQGPVVEGSSADEHHEMVQSNVNILTSRDIAALLLKDIGVERVYPKLAKNPPARGTVMDIAVQQFAADLTVKTESESDIINVGIYNPDPEVAQQMLSRLIDIFIARQSEIYANPQTAALREQAEVARVKLEDAQKRLYAYKNSTGLASIEEELTLHLRERSDLETELLNKERSYAGYRSGPNSPMQNDPDVIAIRGQIKKLDAKIAVTSQQKSEFDSLARENDIDTDNYKAAQTRAQEAEANQGLNQEKITHISVIEQPLLPFKPAKPWKTMITAFSFLIGIMLASAACIIVEILDQSFSFPEQASAALGIPVFASFAYQTAGNNRRSTARI